MAEAQPTTTASTAEDSVSPAAAAQGEKPKKGKGKCGVDRLSLGCSLRLVEGEVELHCFVRLPRCVE